MLKFQNKTVLVTGSGTGIGQAITKKFVENGASAVILGRRKEPLEETAKMLEEIIKEKQSNATVKIFDGVDVSDEKAVTDMFDSLKSENVNLDVVVNNAGVSGPVTCFAHAPLCFSLIISSSIFAVSSNGSFLLPRITALAPFSTNFLVIACPIPVPLPVTKTVLF